MRRVFILLCALLVVAPPTMAATVYLRSTDGSDSDDGSTWALAKATIAAAETAAGVDGLVYVSDNHAESAIGAKTLTSPGTAAQPVRVICVDDAAEPPTALATTATVTTTTSSPSINFTGAAYYYGITFIAGSGSAAATMNIGTSNSFLVFDACNLRSDATSSYTLTFGPITSNVPLCEIRCLNTNYQVAVATAAAALSDARVVWTGGAITGTTFPTSWLTGSANRSDSMIVAGMDLSNLGSGNSLVNAATNGGSFDFVNCKLGSSVSVTTGSIASQAGTRVQVINSDSGDTNYRYNLRAYEGTIDDETTITRTGGASDGTTGRSLKYVSSANTKIYAPLYGPWMTFWNETTGSGVTVAAEVASFGSAALDDDDVWIDIQYLGTSGVPLSVLATDRGGDVLTDSTADQDASTATWTAAARQNSFNYSVNDVISVQGKIWICTADTGSSNASEPAGYATANDGDSVTDGNCTFRAAFRQKCHVASITPQEKGPIRARVCVAKPSTTVYVDPFILTSSARQWQTASSTFINEAPQAGGGIPVDPIEGGPVK